MENYFLTLFKAYHHINPTTKTYNFKRYVLLIKFITFALKIKDNGFNLNYNFYHGHLYKCRIHKESTFSF
ncbi:hypothetical protein BHZ80_24580 [Salmonella enterica]|nr:hypothetical protein [Salmonella enterica]EAA9598314.1 hypothetical protein [Salmonella enterica]EAO9640015.1 hypothetical protein [Salmonella enterica]